MTRIKLLLIKNWLTNNIQYSINKISKVGPISKIINSYGIARKSFINKLILIPDELFLLLLIKMYRNIIKNK